MPQEQNNNQDQIILQKFKEDFKNQYGKELPDGITSTSQLLDLFDKELQRQDEISRRRDTIYESFGFKKIQETPKEGEVIIKEPVKELSVFDDGRLDNLQPQQITEILKRDNKFTTLDGEQIQRISKNNNIPVGFLLTMIKNEGLITSDTPTEQEKTLERMAKFINKNYWNNGVKNISDLANKLNPKNQNLPKVLSNIYQSINPNL